MDTSSLSFTSARHVTMVCTYVPDALSNVFYKYGKFVGRHPLPFLLVPPCVAFALMVGLINIESTGDAEYLYVPVNARGLDERDYFEDTFVFNDREYFTAQRLTTIAGFVQIYIYPQSGNDVLRDDVVDATKTLDTFVREHVARFKGDRYQYNDICARWNDTCTNSGFLQIVGDSSIDSLSISYPFHTDAQGGVFSLVSEVGGVEYPDGVLTSARSLLLSYFVRSQSSSDEKRAEEWLNSLRDELFDYDSDVIKIEFQTSLTLSQELEASLGSIVTLFIIAYNILVIFAIGACLMFDWVRAKPWVALGGLAAAGLGIVSSIGIMSAAGVKFASVVGTMPFLIMGKCSLIIELLRYGHPGFFTCLYWD